jgi:hypothetical protein
MPFSFLLAEIDFAFYYCIKGIGSQVDPKKFEKNGHTEFKSKKGTRQVLYSSEAPPILQYIKIELFANPNTIHP